MAKKWPSICLNISLFLAINHFMACIHEEPQGPLDGIEAPTEMAEIRPISSIETLPAPLQITLDRPRGQRIKLIGGWHDMAIEMGEMPAVELEDEGRWIVDAQGQAIEITQGDWAQSDDPTRCPESTGDEVKVKIPAGIHLFIDNQCGRVRLFNPDQLPSLYIGTAQGDIEVHGASDLGRVRLDSAQGDIFYSGLSKNLRLNTVSGNITAAGQGEIPKLSANSATGHIALALPIRRAKLFTTSGSILATQLRGQSRVHSARGNIVLHWQALPTDLNSHIEAPLGDLSISLPPDGDPQGQIFMGQSHLRSNLTLYPSPNHRAELRLGGGGHHLHLESVEGKVDLHRRPHPSQAAVKAQHTPTAYASPARP